MKDIVIAGNRVKRELWVLLGCFVAAVIFDVAGIIKYGKSFVEVFQTIGYETVIGLALYFVLALVRCAIWLIFKIFKH